MAREFRLPDLGEGITEGQIVRVLCKEGDNVAEDQAILEVETDKAAVEIPSPFAGVASKIHVSEGQTVSVGEVLVTFNGDGAAGGAPAAKVDGAAKADGAAKPAKAEAPKAEAKPAPSAPQRTAPAPAAAPAASAMHRTRAAAAPAVRKFARESGVDIDTLAGSGPGGRVLKSDVEAAMGGGSPAPAGRAVGGAAPAPAPVVSTVSFDQLDGQDGSDNYGEVKTQPLSQIRKTIARQMVKSVSTIPHVTQTDEADVTILESIRKDLRGEDGSGPRVTLMAFIIKALTHCLREHPVFNATFDSASEQIIYKQYINVGIAVDSPRGLVVPVMRNVDRLSVLGISQELVNVAQKVRNVQFTVDELRGGTFTVTNYGAIGSIIGTPIINHPEVAILGVGRTQKRLAMDGEDLVEQDILPLSLSFDHRATDGAQAGRFLNDIVAHLSDPGLLLIK